MKFETKDGMKFEVSNLTHIVINTVRRVIKPGEKGKPSRVTKEKVRDNGDKGTRVWMRFDTTKGIRWGKFRFEGQIPEMFTDITEAEAYQSHAECQKKLEEAMRRPDARVRFSGTYCNIEITSNYAEVQQLQAWERMRKEKKRVHDDVTDALAYAFRGMGPHTASSQTVTQLPMHMKYVDTPFGKIGIFVLERDQMKTLQEIKERRAEALGTFRQLCNKENFGLDLSVEEYEVIDSIAAELETLDWMIS